MKNPDAAGRRRTGALVRKTNTSRNLMLSPPPAGQGSP